MKASDILGFNDLCTKVVHIDKWGCDLTVQELGLSDGIRLVSLISTDDDSVNAEAIAQVVAMGVIDDNGDRLFSDEDIPALAQKNGKALMELYAAITGLAIEAAEKN